MKELALVMLLVYATWVAFLATVNLYNYFHTGRMPLWMKFAAMPILVMMVILDFVLNIVASVPFLEAPWRKMQDGRRAWLLTLRCDFHISGGGSPYQQMLGRWVCRNLLDPFEVGGHCSKV